MSLRNRFFALALGGLVATSVMAPGEADAARRSGGSFSGRGGFRSTPSPSQRVPARVPYQQPGGGTNVVVVPGGGWGFSPFGGWGYGGGFGLGSAVFLGVGAVGALLAFRALRMAKIRRQEALEGGGRRVGLLGGSGYDDDEDGYIEADRSYVYKVQLGLGRSARGLQQRLEQFAADGDTSSEAGLAQLLQQTALELMREKDSIRYGQAEGAGPMSLQKGETKLNGLALAERSRFEVERVRGADGKVRRSQAAAATSDEVLEYLLVTVLVATRVPLELGKLTDLTELETVLRDLGGVAPEALLGLEVVWTPADPDDALTEKELLATYPELRSL
jgi:uncharacterized membrane protein